MANKIEKFMKKNLGSVRVVMHRNKPWFVLSDVMKALGYSENTMTSDALKKLDKTEFRMENIHTKKGVRPTSTVNESGLYYLICTSTKPKAKEFRLWVTGTVLPAIRKNGGYVAGQEKLKPSERIKLEAQVRALAEKVDELTEKNESLKSENDDLAANVSALVYAKKKEAYIATNDGGYVTEDEYERYYA